MVIINYNMNYWNTTKEKGGGNYWFTPEGTGFSETHADKDNDGFCDNPNIINTDNIDYLPRLIDTQGSTLTVHSPVNKSIFNTDRFMVNITAVDASGVDKIIFEFEDSNATLSYPAKYYNKTYDSLKDKNYSLTLYAFDNLGHRSVKKLWVVTDTKAPNIAINTPINNTVYDTSNICINATATDINGIKEVIANINNENITLTKTGDYYLAEKTLNDGTYLLNVTSTDNANNSNSTSVNITIDTYVPSSSNNNRRRTIDASDSIESKSLRRTVSDSTVVYGSNFDKQLANSLKENTYSDDTEIDGDTIILGGPVSNRIANQYNDRFTIPVTNDNPGTNRGIIQVISIPSGSSSIVQSYKLIYIAGSDRLGTEAALKYFETLTELPDEPITVEWVDGKSVLV
ncbi:hypothetical protein J3E05_000117 [Methanococcus voltae]|nr:hypothetical protein [Methanococcus voltae]